ncbi:siderophore-interacting protein [Nocardioides oleivorans]|uniref:Siderophore-interacting protein n=2 Tax=Nocardioides oleivorans TaxID=273676 RepID=A0A4Q2S2Z6_9ACTN|nr:siderophore-interacting protein [Nocardioides oleivorans]
MRVHRAEVVRVEELAPWLRRVVLGGAGLADFESTGVGDEYLRVMFPPEGETEPRLPVVEDGVFDFAQVDLALLRTYTVRDHDPVAGEVTIDFVVHDGGVASTWARGAEPGDVVGLNSPTAMYDAPADLVWQVLAADAAALPALSRIIENTPVGVRTRVVLELPDADTEVPLPSHPGLDPDSDVVRIVSGNGHGPSRLPEVVESLTRPDGVGYVWVAGESKALRGVRKHLRHALGLPASAYKSVGYWIEDAEKWREDYDALDADTKAALDALWESDRDEEDIEDEYDARLTALGL